MSEYVVVALAGLLIGLSKGGLGGPVPISLTAPLLSLIMPVSEAVGLILPLLIFADIFAIKSYWMDWDMKYFRLLMPTAVIGVLMGSFLLGVLPEVVLRKSLALFTLSIVTYKIISDSLQTINYVSQQWHGYFAGWLSGFGSSLANAGSPPFTAYMLLQGVTPITFIGTTTLFFAVINLLKLPPYLLANVINADRLIGTIWAMPIIPLGVWLGRELINRINAKVFEWLMMGLLAIMSVILLVT